MAWIRENILGRQSTAVSVDCQVELTHFYV